MRAGSRAGSRRAPTWWWRSRSGRRPTRSTASSCSAPARAARIRNGRTSRAPIQTAIQEALTGAKPADVALQEAAKKIAPILAKTPL